MEEKEMVIFCFFFEYIYKINLKVGEMKVWMRN